MKEHGILFTAPMVRAILAGTKTQTRRTLNPQPTLHDFDNGKGPIPSLSGRHVAKGIEHIGCDASAGLMGYVRAPHGPVGRRLWVRETWCAPGAFATLKTGRVTYRADIADGKNPLGHPWKPAIHMPRWASRITLEVTRVRLERVQSITEDDARAEGVELETAGPVYRYADGRVDARSVYADLWDTINGAGSWASNPWVWAYDFKRVE